MKGYVKASRYYYDAALVQKDGRLAPGSNYDEVVAITAKYTGASPQIIKLGFPFQDRKRAPTRHGHRAPDEMVASQRFHQAHAPAEGNRGHIVRRGSREIRGQLTEADGQPLLL